MKLLVATRSRGKQAEFRELLAPLRVTILLPDDIDLPEISEESDLESGDTFQANAAAKAWWFAQRSGLVALADDSGLEVDALHGAPGVHSKRFAGRDGPDHIVAAANNAALLSALAGVAAVNRHARYSCVLVLARPKTATDWDWSRPRAGESLVAEGTTEGRILMGPLGSAGFGYDPLFFSNDLGCSFGEASADAKHGVSHRGRAVLELLQRLQSADGAHTP